MSGRVNEPPRRTAVKILLGTATALCVGMAATALGGFLVGEDAKYIKPAPTGAIRVVLCQTVDACPDEYSVDLSQLEGGPIFKLLQRGTMTIPAVFGLVRSSDSKEYPAAYVPICTHFGCPVNYLKQGRYLSAFSCPCHGSYFVICNELKGCQTGYGTAKFLEAYVAAGPAPRSLRPIVVGIRGTRVYALEAYI